MQQDAQLQHYVVDLYVFFPDKDTVCMSQNWVNGTQFLYDWHVFTKKKVLQGMQYDIIVVD
jgi:hypothetical protein